MSTENKAVTTANQAAPALADQSYSQRFTNRVVSEFKATSGGIELSDKQKRLISNYFIAVDQVLKTAEEKRQKKAEAYREPLPYEWANVNMETLAIRVVAFSKLGLDPTQPNHLFPIPYKNATTNKYDITMMMGYRGIEVKATKYGLNVPKNTVIEVVFKNDEFLPIKKDRNNPVETYDFSVPKPFDRGEIVGGFYYMEYDDSTKNKLVFMSIAEIEKRKPKFASVEFWGDEKVDGKNQKNGKEKIEGWHYEMVYKTLVRAAFNSITIDADKIDDSYMTVLNAEREATILEAAAEVEQNANKTELSFDNRKEITSDKLPEGTVIVMSNGKTAEPVKVEHPTAVNEPNGQLTAKF